MPFPKLMQPPNGFVFEEPEGRPFRLCSIETEVDGRGTFMAQELYQHGIIHEPHVQNYGWKPPMHYDKVAFLKYDGSVTGGELVFDLLDLTNPVHSAALMRALERLRVLEKEGFIQYNPNCGGHIHIDASGFGYYDVVRLMTLFGFLEEPIYRLAGAGKTYGHRTLYRGYDRANAGNGYANPIKKGPFEEPRQIYRLLSSQGRMSGLNVVPYMSGENCCSGECGSNMVFVSRDENRFEIRDKKTCTCPMQKNTLEWRVWNSQGNPRILYAWIALMQAMHAWAWRPADSPNYPKHEPMPEYSWTWKPFNKLTTEQQRLAQDRVQFIFHELPLTSLEKDALRYAFMRTPYKKFGKEWFNQQANTPYKPPPYPNVYEIPIKKNLGLAPDGKPWPEAGDDVLVPF